jgi:phenylacetate-CoA ligase
VNVECEKQESASVHERLSSELARAVKAYVGVTATVNVHACGTIERSSGKAKRVVDRRRI